MVFNKPYSLNGLHNDNSSLVLNPNFRPHENDFGSKSSKRIDCFVLLSKYFDFLIDYCSKEVRIKNAIIWITTA